MMSGWLSSLLLAVSAVIGLSLADPGGEYRIPEVGNGERSQYYILHADGTFKYGFDTGEGGFESVKSDSPGSRDGEFGYVDPDGRTIKLEYEAGLGGFVARGDHLPKASPELAEALAAVVRSNREFIDPLANSDSDKSYGFKFDSEHHSRREESDSDGTVSGSYSYIDENGVTRSFNYKAGKGIGFVIQGDGLTQDIPASNPVTPYSNPFSNSVAGFRSTSNSAPARPSNQHAFSTRSQYTDNTSSFNSRHRTSGNHKISYHQKQHISAHKRPTFPQYSQTAPTRSNNGRIHIHKTSTTNVNRPHSFRNKISRTNVQNISNRRPSRFRSRQPPIIQSETEFHPSQQKKDNFQTSFSPSGSYSFSYDTETHSRSEAGDENNRVEGNFEFEAEDDGIKRKLYYESSRDTGFIAEGRHLPVGPVVPGSPSGQPTGRLEKTSDSYVDPLAKENTDASYKFGFNSDTYSRSETADKDGNVIGTYSIVEEDGSKVTYRFRAGRGIGFETEEIGRSKGNPPPKPTPYQGPLAGSTYSNLPQSVPGSNLKARTTMRIGGTNNGITVSHANKHHNSNPSRIRYSRPTPFNSERSRVRQTPVRQTPSTFRQRQSSFQKFTSQLKPVRARNTYFSPSPSYKQDSRSDRYKNTQRCNIGTRVSHSHLSSARASSNKAKINHNNKLLRSPNESGTLNNGRADEMFPGFTLHRYDPAKDAHKFGYVLRFE